MSFHWLVVSPLVSLLLVACTSAKDPPPISASDYDQTCTADSDCVEINVGDVCGCIGCGGGAINAKDEAKYQSDVTQRAAECHTHAACPGFDCVCSRVACIAKTCAVELCAVPGLDAGTD